MGERAYRNPTLFTVKRSAILHISQSVTKILPIMKVVWLSCYPTISCVVLKSAGYMNLPSVW